MMTPQPYYQTPADSRSCVRLYLGDCREILPLVAPPSKRVIVLADPPYGRGHTRAINRSHVEGEARQQSAKAHKGAMKNRVWTPLLGDDEPFDPSHLLAYQRLVVWGWNHFSSRMPEPSGVIVWDKRAGSEPDDGSDLEQAWTNLGGPDRICRHLWRGTCRASETGAPHLHVSQKPEDVYRWLFAGRGRGKPVVEPGDVVVVPYIGSGPEVPPALELGLDVIGIDVERSYLDVVIKHRIKPHLAKARQLDIWTPRTRTVDQIALFTEDQS